MSTRASNLLIGLALLLLAGCGMGDPLADRVAPIPPTFASPAAAAAPTGGIWDSRGAPVLLLAEDRRARNVGDLLTIRLVDRTEAQKSVEQDGNRQSNRSLDLPDSQPFSTIPEALLGGGSQSGFSGSGSARQQNRISGEFTVTVVQVLPNGALLVGGERRTRLVRGEEQVQLTGLVRPEDIGADNRVPSTRVADARVRYTGTGEVAAQARQGWLSRFFDRVTPF